MANTNYICLVHIWWINCFNTRDGRSPFYLHYILVISILGISAFYHDSAAAIVIDGEIVAAAQEERFSRKKHDSSYPYHAIEFVLNFSKIKVSELDAIVFF